MTINFKYFEISVTVIADKEIIREISFILGEFIDDNILITKNNVVQIELDNCFYVIKKNGKKVFKSSSIDLIILNLYSTIVNIFVFEAKNIVFLHAGAIEKDNRIILLLGKSKSGKTSLTSFLSKKYNYNIVSDEIVPINIKDNELYVFPRVLSLRKETIKALNFEPSKGKYFNTIDNEKVLLVKREHFFCVKKDVKFKISEIDRIYHVSFGDRMHLSKMNSFDAIKLFLNNVCNFENLSVENIKAIISFVENKQSYNLKMNNIEDSCDLIKKGFYE